KSLLPFSGDGTVGADCDGCGAEQFQRGKAAIGMDSEPRIDLRNSFVGHLPIGGDGPKEGYQFSDDPNRFSEGHYRRAISGSIVAGNEKPRAGGNARGGN